MRAPLSCNLGFPGRSAVLGVTLSRLTCGAAKGNGLMRVIARIAASSNDLLTGLFGVLFNLRHDRSLGSDPGNAPQGS